MPFAWWWLWFTCGNRAFSISRRFLASRIGFDPEIMDRENRLEPGDFQVLLAYEGQRACVWKTVEVVGKA